MNTSTVSYLAALLLCVSFFLQGANYAKADTTEAVAVVEVQPVVEEVAEVAEVTEVEEVEEVVVEPTVEEVTEVADSSEVVNLNDDVEVTNAGGDEENLNITPEVEEVIEEDSVTTDIEDTESDDVSVVDDSSEVGTGETAGGELEDVTEADTETETNTDIENDTETISTEEPTTVDDQLESDTATENSEDDLESASSTELVEEELLGTAESVSVVQSDTAYTFNREECTKLATGSFYCLKPIEDLLEDALFAAPDADGDLEIFLVRGGVQSQVTTNQVDDAAPYFDENSNTIVWHRLYNDRFQIVSYDIDSGEETLLTNTSENNMEPTRQGDYTVWQRWVDGSWNIILHDGQGEMKLTNNGGHNVAPYVHGSLVVWNRHNSDGQKTIEMFDIDTHSYVSVPDAEGLSVSNPRMVFVFDSLTPEGDIITKGYDVLSRKFIDLDSLPVNLPDEIPNSDSTGETRALIQSKPTVKSEVEELVESEMDISVTGPEPELEPLTLNLASSTLEVATTSAPVVESMAEFELIIEPYNGTTTSSSSEQIVE